MAFIDRPGARIAWESAGEGPPVLFIQGAGVPGVGWRPQVDALAGAYRCAWFDHRGIGGSTLAERRFEVGDLVGDALGVLDALSWPRAHVVGHSLGGIVAAELALAAPERVKSLALLCTFTCGQEAARLTPFMAWIGLRTRVGTRRMRRRAFLELVLTPGEQQGDLDAAAERFAPFFGRDLADQPPVVLAQVAAMSRHGPAGRLGAIRAPTRVVSGADDRLALPRFGAALAAAIPGAAYTCLPDAAHGVPISHPERINPLLAEHFAAVDARG